MFKLALMTGVAWLIRCCPSRDCLSGEVRSSFKVKKACPLASIFSQALMQYHLTCSIAWLSISTWSWVLPSFKEMGLCLAWSWDTIIKWEPSASPCTMPKVQGEFTPWFWTACLSILKGICLCTASHTPLGLLGSVPGAIRLCIVTGNAIIIASKSPSFRVQQTPFWRGDRTAVLWGRKSLSHSSGQGRKGQRKPVFPKGSERTAALRASGVFCSILLGSAFSGPPSDGISLSSSLPSELSRIWRGSKTDFISAQVDQIDTGKSTPLQRGFCNSLRTFSHFPKSKVRREGNYEQRFSMVCESANSRPSLVSVPPAFKSCLLFPAFWIPMPGFNAWESITYRKGGFSEASLHSSAGPSTAHISTSVFLAEILHIPALNWAPLAATAGRDPKWSTTHSLGKRN